MSLEMSARVLQPLAPLILPEPAIDMTTAMLSARGVFLLTLASAIVTANAYYIHPIIGRVADTFGVSAALVGAVPAFNQIALALGILLLLPLGDRMSNRRLVLICLAAQTLSLLVMAIATGFWFFVAGSTVLGFFTVTPYLLPAYASKRVSPARLGFVTAMLTTGVVAGVLLSRTGSGVVAEFLGWRQVYCIAAALMMAATVCVPLLMDDDETSAEREQLPYRQLLTSLGALAQRYPRVIASGAIQGLSFAIFLTAWMGIGLHLTGPDMGFGTDTVGYLSAFAAVNLLTTPRLGAWADRVGAQSARVVVCGVQLLGVMALGIAGQSVWLLILPIILLSLAGPMIDITGRMTALGETPDIRTRLMTLYIVLMFLGAGFGSWGGTVVYDLYGWRGTCGLALALSLVVLFLSFRERRVAAATLSP